MAAGGSIVQENVPAIALTPLAPHSLSFRPLILPDNVDIIIKKPKDGRGSAWVSLDGATRFELKEGQYVTIGASEHPITFIKDPTESNIEVWAQRLTKLLNWNTRPT
jgi:NAD+ kinase